ncbi:MAG: response regulator transcription factor [Elusimicrobiota bacterium]
MGYRILAVHQDIALKGLVESCSADADFMIRSVNSGGLGLEELKGYKPDLVLLQSDLPDIDGLSWLKIARSSREGRDIPIMLLGRGPSEPVMAQAFSLGADDFVDAKACDPHEFSARVRVALRRRYQREDVLGDVLESGPVRLDPVRHSCRVRGKAKGLRPREFELLEILMRKAGRVLGRVYLLESVWGMSRLADTRTVDVTVSRLRAALGARAGRWVETVERFGYRFREPSSVGR